MSYGWKPYVPVAERRRKAALETARLQKKGISSAPVVVQGRELATTFWGKSWCSNLEAYSDYANRLPRGRTYVRNGSVVDLQVAGGEIKARVMGSEMYQVTVKVAPLSKAHWAAICNDCAGSIDSLVELLQGRLSQAVMARVCQQKTGLFPAPSEITLACSCPDWADMCKHVAAVLYGIGVRLDEQPSLVFKLRAVDERELIASAARAGTLATQTPAPAKVLDADDLSALFGLEMEGVTPPEPKLEAATQPTIQPTIQPGSKAATQPSVKTPKRAPAKKKPPTPAPAPARKAAKKSPTKRAIKPY